MRIKDKLELELDSNNLKLHYSPVSEKVIFDICDQNGKICHSGTIDGDITICNVENISSGNYFVYVIDSGQIHKKPIRI